MILRLLAAGYEVVVWNRTREKILPVLEAGATEAESPASVTSQVDFVFQCLTDAQAVEQVVFGDEGISGAGSEQQVLVDFSSMRPDLTREFSTRLREQCGMGWVDAHVSGGVKGAEEGTLAIMAGGEATDVERVRDAGGERAIDDLAGLRHPRRGGAGVPRPRHRRRRRPATTPPPRRCTLARGLAGWETE